jgi:hypothetical protein
VVGAVDDSKQEHSEVVSHLLTYSMLYEFICCMNSYCMNSYKNISKGSGKELAVMQVKEDGVVGAVDDAVEEQGVVVSCTLTSYKLYEFMYCLNSFII